MERLRQPSLLAGTALGLGVLGVAVAFLHPLTSGDSRATPSVILVVPVVVAAIAGGRAAALLTATAAAAALNLAFIPPRGTFKIDSVVDGVAFAVFVAVAMVVGTLVASEAERRRAAERREGEVQALHAGYEEMSAERERFAEEARKAELLTQAEEQRRALLRSVSHDLRTPLAAIRAVTSDMRAGTEYDDATRAELLDVVVDEAERLDRLVASLVSLSRVEAGAFGPDREAVAVSDVVEIVTRRLGRLFREVAVENTIPPGMPLVDVDPSQLDQVITNLLENAARHSAPGSRVEIGGEVVDSGWARFWVRDDGPGVDLAAREKLFEPFGRGPDSESSGIGLATCRAIVNAHGGEIDVDNGQDGGAIFHFTLPRR